MYLTARQVVPAIYCVMIYLSFPVGDAGALTSVGVNFRDYVAAQSLYANFVCRHYNRFPTGSWYSPVNGRFLQ